MTLPLRHQRTFWLIGAALLLQCLFAVLPVPLYARSERMHATVIGVWLLHYLVWQRREPDPRRAAKFILLTGVVIGLTVSFWNLLEWQARTSSARADFREVLWRVALAGSLFILYSCWTQALDWLLRRSGRMRTLLSTPRGRWLNAARIAVALASFAPYLFTSLNSHRYKLGNIITPQSAHQLPYRDVTFTAEDGVSLSGWLMPGDKSRAVVVCHGLGANRSIFLGVAPFLRHAGYTVLMFDFRGHGDSGGHTVSFGHDEARDVAAAVTYLQAQGYRQIALYGFSMGGAAVLNAAGNLPVQAVVVDSTFADFAPLVAQNLPQRPRWLARAALAITDFSGFLELGVSAHGISPRPHITFIAPRPILIIHGLQDSLIPFRQAQTIERLAGQPKQLWLVPKAEHCLCRLVDTPRYEARVAAFLKQSMDGAAR